MWAVVNKDVDFTKLMDDMYFATLFFTKQKAKDEWRKTKSVDLHIVAVLIKPV